MRDKWQTLLQRFAALNARERWLVLVAIFAVAYQAADLLILNRQFAEIQRLNSAMVQDNAAIVRVNTELNMLAQRALDDPNKRLRQQIESARSEVQGLQARLRDATDELISPQQMARLLEDMLVRQDELTMLRLQTLEARPLLAQDGEQSNRRDGLSALHRHGFALEFSGSYLATLDYLKTLERLPWQFFWDSVDYEVLEYPYSVVRLKLYTLSLSEDWIGV